MDCVGGVGGPDGPKAELFTVPFQRGGRRNGMVPVAQNPVMHPGEMAEIEEVLHCARGAAFPFSFVAEDYAKARVVEWGKFRDGRPGLAHANPDDTVPLFGVVFGEARLLRNGMLRRNRGDPCAPAVGIVRPAVVGADDALPLYPSQRDRCSPVNAQVVKRRYAVSQPTDGQALIQKTDGKRPLAHLFAEGDRQPVAP